MLRNPQHGRWKARVEISSRSVANADYLCPASRAGFGLLVPDVSGGLRHAFRELAHFDITVAVGDETFEATATVASY